MNFSRQVADATLQTAQVPQFPQVSSIESSGDQATYVSSALCADNVCRCVHRPWLSTVQTIAVLSWKANV